MADLLRGKLLYIFFRPVTINTDGSHIGTHACILHHGAYFFPVKPVGGDHIGRCKGMRHAGDIKGKNIVLLNLKDLDDAPADYFIVCEGDSTTQVRAIANNIEKRLKVERRLSTPHVEGTQHAKWICMDYFDVIVHIFHPETRRFYDLEQLWSDAEKVEYHNL